MISSSDSARRFKMLTRRLAVAVLALTLVAGVVAADDAIDGMTPEQMELEIKKIHDEVLPTNMTQKISPPPQTPPFSR